MIWVEWLLWFTVCLCWVPRVPGREDCYYSGMITGGWLSLRSERIPEESSSTFCSIIIPPKLSTGNRDTSRVGTFGVLLSLRWFRIYFRRFLASSCLPTSFTWVVGRSSISWRIMSKSSGILRVICLVLLRTCSWGVFSIWRGGTRGGGSLRSCG